MPTSTEISNLTLTHIGVGKTISDLDSEKSSEASAIRTVYDLSLRETLRDFMWPFATKIAPLALVATDPNTEWKFAYAYPSDCVAMRRIPSGIRNDNRQSQVPFRLAYGDAGQVIYTDKESAQAEYTLLVTDGSRYPADFVYALSFRIAFYVAPRLTGGDPFKLGSRAADAYNSIISQARANAGNEEKLDQEPDAEFIRERNDGFNTLVPYPWRYP